MQTLSLGKHNPKLLELRKAIQRGELTPSGLLPLEGPKLLAEAEKSKLEIMELYLRRGVSVDTAVRSPRVFELDPAAFKSIQSTESSQGVLAVVRPVQFSIADVLRGSPGRIVVLGRLQDPGNVGTILRIGEAMGATGCLALNGTVSNYNPKTIRASAGSVFRFPHVWSLELPAARKHLKETGMSIVGTSPSGSELISDWDWSQPTAFLIGNEGGGLSDAERNACDRVLRIPQNPAVESLNSAIATAIILYEASKHERISV